MDRLGRVTFCLICIVAGATQASSLQVDALPCLQQVSGLT